MADKKIKPIISPIFGVINEKQNDNFGVTKSKFKNKVRLDDQTIIEDFKPEKNITDILQGEELIKTEKQDKDIYANGLEGVLFDD